MASMAVTDRRDVNFVVYRDRQTLKWSVEAFAADEQDAAFARLFALENHFADQHSIDIVLLGAESLETIRYTHGDLFVGEECPPPVVPIPSRV